MGFYALLLVLLVIGFAIAAVGEALGWKFWQTMALCALAGIIVGRLLQ